MTNLPSPQLLSSLPNLIVPSLPPMGLGTGLIICYPMPLFKTRRVVKSNGNSVFILLSVINSFPHSFLSLASPINGYFFSRSDNDIKST